MIVLATAGWVYGMRVTRADRREIEQSPWTCEVCDGVLPHDQLSAHRKAEHPGEAGYLCPSGIVVLAFLSIFLGALLGLFHVFLLGVVDGGLFECAFLSVLAVGVVAMLAMVAWGTLVHPRRVQRAREAWRSRGLETKGP